MHQEIGKGLFKTHSEKSPEILIREYWGLRVWSWMTGTLGTSFAALGVTDQIGTKGGSLREEIATGAIGLAVLGVALIEDKVFSRFIHEEKLKLPVSDT